MVRENKPAAIRVLRLCGVLEVPDFAMGNERVRTG
jgi:hypothetical protein